MKKNDLLPRVRVRHRKARPAEPGLMGLFGASLPAMWAVVCEGKRYPAAEFEDWGDAVSYAHQLSVREQTKAAHKIIIRAENVRALYPPAGEKP